MKWTNRGHEFDTLGEYYKKTKTIYIWGAVERNFEYQRFLESQVSACNNGHFDLDISYVDNNLDKQCVPFHNRRVISKEQLLSEFDANNGVLILCVIEPERLWEQIVESCSLTRKINVFNQYEFYRYLSVFIYYRYHKLYFSTFDMFAHTNCNLKCKHCFIQNYRGVKKTLDFETVKKNIDKLFKKFDYIYIFLGGIADGFCYQDFDKMVAYLYENYRERYGQIDVVTNGTIIPNNNLIKALQTPKTRVIVDDYRENVQLARQNYPKIIDLLQKNKVWHEQLKRDHWDNAGLLVRESKGAVSDEELIAQHDNCICHAKGFPYYGYRENTDQIYSCVFQTINAYYNLIEETQNDSIDLSAPKVEILEYLLGYSEKGYLSACKYCTGILEGETMLHVPVAEQITSSQPLQMVGDCMCRKFPTHQNAVDIFAEDWLMRFPAEYGVDNKGVWNSFDTSEIKWSFTQFGSLEGKHVLELGFCDGGHTYQIEKTKPLTLTCIDANTKAYLKALITKEITQMKIARFYLGDFIQFLENTNQKWDVIYASGVLYHMTDPLALLANIAKHTDNVFINTHYFAPNSKGQQGTRPYCPIAIECAYEDYKCTGHIHPYSYNGEINTAKFAGGEMEYGVWLERNDILQFMEKIGFTKFIIQYDKEEADLPNIAFIARKG